jgi:hypothetical protein
MKLAHNIRLLALASVLSSGVIHAALLDMTISGTGSGDLGGVAFSDTAFKWSIIYDTAKCDFPWAQYGDNATRRFAVTDSTLTLAGVGSPITVTEPHSVWCNSSPDGVFYCGPIRGAEGLGPPYGNILNIDGYAYWDGLSPLLSCTLFATGSESYGQFYDIATDHGLLTMQSGTTTGFTVTAVTPVPEPSTYLAALIALGMAGLFGWRDRK